VFSGRFAANYLFKLPLKKIEKKKVYFHEFMIIAMSNKCHFDFFQTEY